MVDLIRAMIVVYKCCSWCFARMLGTICRKKQGYFALPRMSPPTNDSP